MNHTTHASKQTILPSSHSIHHPPTHTRPTNPPKRQRKIRDSEYTALKEFCADVELMVQNALTFNREGETVHTFAKETRELFYKQLRKHKEDYALREDEE